MFGLNWLRQKARQLKELAFFISGASVAMSTATAKAAPVVSWIANLIAVAAAGSYSIFKNTETAATIKASQQEIFDTRDTLTLSHYRVNPTPLSEVLIQTAVFSEEESGQLQKSLLRNFTTESRSYVNWNMVLQTSLGIIAIAINSWANTESENQSKTLAYYLNLILVPICILSQYLTHMAFTADNLRDIATNATALQTRLSDVRHGLLFGALERKSFIQCKESLAKELEDISRMLDAKEEQKRQIHHDSEKLQQELELIDSKISEARARFGDFNIELYVTAATAEEIIMVQLAQKLAELSQKNITVEFCFDYIHNKQEYSQIRENITLLRKKIDVLSQQIQEQIAEKESLIIRYNQLLQKESGIRLVDIALQKLDQINSSPI